MIFNQSKYNSNWQTLMLDELGEFKRGKSKHRPRNDKRLFENGNYPLVQTGEIKDANLYVNSHSSAYNDFGLAQSKLWPENTLCITIAANIAETAILSYPMCFPDSIVGFNSFKNHSITQFVHYVFTYIRKSIQSAASGSIQDNINIDFLSKIRFKIPSLDTQFQIAKVLSDIDAKIELNNKINAELEAMAKLIYDYWFVQFDFPISEEQAKEMGHPELAGKPYKSSGGKMVYNEELKREIPEGWDIDYIENILQKEARTKKLLSYKFQTFGKIPIIDQSTDFVCGYTDDDETMIETTKPRIIFGDHTRILKLINFNFARGADGTQVLLSNSERVPQYLFFHSLLKIDLSNYGYARHFKFLKQTRIIIPELELAKRFDDQAKSFYDITKHNFFENQKLTHLRDWLLPMLMNGQVSVDGSESVEAEKQAEGFSR